MKIQICIGTSCYLKGAYNVLQYFQHQIEKRGLHGEVEISGAFCMGNCQNGVSVKVNGRLFGVSPDGAAKFFEDEIMSKLSA